MTKPCNVCGSTEEPYEAGGLWWCDGCATYVTQEHLSDTATADRLAEPDHEPTCTCSHDRKAHRLGRERRCLSCNCPRFVGAA